MSSITTKVIRTTDVQQTNNKNKRTQQNRSRRIRKRAGRRQVKNQIGNELRVMIPKCTADYASALVNPFGTRQTLPCIPDNMTIPSFKYQSKVRGVFSTGTLGVGWVSLNPWMMFKNDGGNGTTTTSYPIVYTTSEYNNNTFDPDVSGSSFETGVAGANSNSILNDAVFTADRAQLRLVAAGLRISYTGSNFRNQGRVLLYRNQGNSQIPSGWTSSNLLANSYTSVVPISRKSEYVFYTPDAYLLNGYFPSNQFDPNVGAVDRRCMLIYIDGGDQESPQSWLFEAVAYFEAIGLNMSLSASHSDPNGLGDVIESLPVRNPIGTPAQVQTTVFQRLLALAKQKAMEYGPTALRLGAKMALNYLGTGYSDIPRITIEDID